VIIEKILPSDCYSEKVINPESIILHYISAVNIDKERQFDIDLCYKILVDYGLSYHLLIGREGDSYHCVPLNNKAYHAGKSSYGGRSNFNNFSIGISLVGGFDTGFTDYQYDELNWQLDYLCTKYGIGNDMILGHEHISKGRKKDPNISGGNLDIKRIERLKDATFCPQSHHEP